MGNNFFCTKPVINVLLEPKKSSKVSSQLIYGEKFQIISKNFEKNKEACVTLTTLSREFSSHKLKNKAEKKKLEISCNIVSEWNLIKKNFFYI